MIDRFEPVSTVRTWTDATGKHKVEAELVGVADGKVTLRKTDGKTTTIALDKLSDADREYVTAQAVQQH